MAYRLWLGFGLVVLLSVVSGIVSYGYIERIERDLLQIVEIEEPLEQAVLEMEINAGETARAVLDYVRDLEPKHIEAMRDSEADFESFGADFARLAETDEERRLGREVARLYEEFKALGEEIVALADERRGAMEIFRRNVLEIDELFDSRLKPSAEENTPNEMNKWKASMALDELIDESFPAVEAYAFRQDPARQQKFLDVGADFERLLALYRETNLSSEETVLLDRINRDFVEAVHAGDQVITVTDRLTTQLKIFEEHLETIDAFLDDEIQPLIHAGTVAAADDAKASTDQAALYLLVLGLGGLCIAIAAAWVIYWGIIGPVRVLVRGTEIIGGGNLDHRIDIGGRNEFSRLAVAFDRMAEKLGGALRSVEDARDRLEQRVKERTEELERVTAERLAAEDALRRKQGELAHVHRLNTASETALVFIHEIGQPLSAISAYAAGGIELLRPGTAQPEDLRNVLSQIQAQGTRAKEVLGLIRGQMQHARSKKTSIKLNELIAATKQLLDFEADHNRVDFSLDLADGLPNVRGDTIQLEQVIVNLELNAIEAMSGAGTPAKRLRIATSRAGTDAVEIAVEDSGPGIHVAMIGKVFEPFYSTKKDGMGMGLAISRSIVDAMGGRLWATSDGVSGATFHVRLPAET